MENQRLLLFNPTPYISLKFKMDADFYLISPLTNLSNDNKEKIESAAFNIRLTKHILEQEKIETLDIADIRNKLSPLLNLVTFIEEIKNDIDEQHHEFLDMLLPQSKKSIEYLSKREQ
jgi:hypothetical protein